MIKYIFFLAAIACSFSSCYYRNGKRVAGNGNRSTEQRNITGFTGVETHGSIDIVASQGNYSVKVDADQNILQYVETNIENGRLKVRFRNGISFTHLNGVTVYVTAPELVAFESHGSGDISSRGKLTAPNNIDVGCYGSGDIELELDCPDIKTSIHGSGNITLRGQTKDLSCETSGSGDMKAGDLKAENVKTSIHGSGDDEVFASVSLDVEIFGSGDVHYQGSPKITSAIHGSGSVSKED